METFARRPSPADFSGAAAQAFEHLRWLSETIGPRGSCTPEELAAAEYAARQLGGMGIEGVEIAPAPGAASTYQRYALLAGLAAIASLAALAVARPVANLAALMVQAAVAQAVLYESDFRRNWSRLVIPDRQSQNVIARQAAATQTRQTIVLVAHLDTARTPAFNASRRGQRAYGLLFRLLMASYLAAALLHAGLAIQQPASASLFLSIPVALQLCSLLLLASLDRAPFSPGAYDNASGSACVLALAARFIQNPLEWSEIWYCLTGCEETGSGGAVDLFRRHAPRWVNPWIINLDQFGYQRIYLRTREGLLRRYQATAECISIARAAAAGLPEVDFSLRPSQAFSDAGPAYQRGMRAFSFGTSPADDSQQTHRHRTSDTPDHLSQAALAENLCYIWSLMQALDSQDQEATSA